MWYHILPSFVIITTFLTVPNIFVYYTNKLLLDQPFKRRINTSYESFQYLRDARLSKRQWAYDFNGLENIPDLLEPAEKPEPATKC